VEEKGTPKKKVNNIDLNDIDGNEEEEKGDKGGVGGN
jgi:hypothetical protein